MPQLLKKEQADELYKKLIEIHIADNRLLDKMHSIRTVFDRMLTLEVTNCTDLTIEQKKALKTFELKVNFLEGKMPGHHQRLDSLRLIFNNIAHPTWVNGTSKRVSVTHQHYMTCLDALINNIAIVSDVPTPVQLNLALSGLRDFDKVAKRQVIIICQINTGHMDLIAGTQFIKDFDSFLARKKELGLTDVEFTLISYYTPITYRDESNILRLSQQDIKDFTVTALEKGYECVKKISLTQRMNGEDVKNRPWLIWIAGRIPKNLTPDSQVIKQITESYQQKDLFFQRLFSNEKAEQPLTALFPEIKGRPVGLDFSKSSLFFDSLALTLHKAAKK